MLANINIFALRHEECITELQGFGIPCSTAMLLRRNNFYNGSLRRRGRIQTSGSATNLVVDYLLNHYMTILRGDCQSFVRSSRLRATRYSRGSTKDERIRSTPKGELLCKAKECQCYTMQSIMSEHKSIIDYAVTNGMECVEDTYQVTGPRK